MDARRRRLFAFRKHKVETSLHPVDQDSCLSRVILPNLLRHLTQLALHGSGFVHAARLTAKKSSSLQRYETYDTPP